MRTPIRRPIVVRPLLSIAAAALLAACAGGVPGATPWLPDSAATIQPPVEVSGRAVVPSCGIEDQREGRGPDQAIRECFLKAHAEGKSAEFASVNTTMEGAPFAEIYQTDGSAITVFADMTQDAWGGNAWIRTVCAAIEASADDWVFGLDACGEGETLAAPAGPS